MKAIIIAVTMALTGCGAFSQNPKCPDTDLLKIESEYVTSVLVFCQKYGGEGEPPVEECPAYPKLRDQAAEKRRQYVECE